MYNWLASSVFTELRVHPHDVTSEAFVPLSWNPTPCDSHLPLPSSPDSWQPCVMSFLLCEFDCREHLLISSITGVELGASCTVRMHSTASEQCLWPPNTHPTETGPHVMACAWPLLLCVFLSFLRSAVLSRNPSFPTGECYSTTWLRQTLLFIHHLLISGRTLMLVYFWSVYYNAVTGLQRWLSG